MGRNRSEVRGSSPGGGYKLRASWRAGVDGEGDVIYEGHVALDDWHNGYVGSVWFCGHRHQSRDEATQCSRTRLDEGGLRASMNALIRR